MPFKYNPYEGEFDWVLGPGSGTATVQFDTDSGSATPDSDGVITFNGGAGIQVTASGNTVVIDNTSGGFTWNEVTTTSQNMSVENGYVANNAALVTLTLPSTAAFGDTVKIIGKGSGLFKIAQNAGQTIHFVASSTTTGIGGSLTAVEQFAALELICTTANTDWTVTEPAGNFTVV